MPFVRATRMAIRHTLQQNDSSLYISATVRSEHDPLTASCLALRLANDVHRSDDVNTIREEGIECPLFRVLLDSPGTHPLLFRISCTAGSVEPLRYVNVVSPQKNPQT